MAFPLHQLQLVAPKSSFSSSSSSVLLPSSNTASSLFCNKQKLSALLRIRKRRGIVFVSKETLTTTQEENGLDPQDLEYISQIKSVLERLRRNRDMTFNEVKLTIMIEDPRDVERRRLLGIDDETAPTRDDLAAVLEEVNEGKIPEDRIALQMLAEEMSSWPNLEVEASKKTRPGRSLYAKATDTGIDLQEAAKRLNIDWDTAAEIEDVEDNDDVEVPPAVDEKHS